MKTFETNLKKYEFGGTFWPLDKWTHEGFDAERIRTLSKPEDKHEHLILGTCYRCPLLYTGQESQRGTERGDNMNVDAKLKQFLAKWQKHIADPADGDQEEENENSDDNSSISNSNSSETSSSSSSSNHKKKNNKKKV